MPGNKKERFAPGSYKRAVYEEIWENRNTYSTPNYFGEEGIFGGLRAGGRMPLWALPFAEKPIQPDQTESYSERIEDEIRLTQLNIPRQYLALDVEREITADQDGRDALIERQYGVKEDDQRDLICIATIVADLRWKARWEDNEWYITVEMPDGFRSEQGGDHPLLETNRNQIWADDLKTLLTRPQPIIKLKIGVVGVWTNAREVLEYM